MLDNWESFLKNISGLLISEFKIIKSLPCCRWKTLISSCLFTRPCDKMLLFINSFAQCWYLILLCLSNPFWVLYALLQIMKVPQLFSNDI